MTNPEGRKTSPFLIVSAWVVVSIPLAWGVYQTARKSLALFRAAESAAPSRSVAERSSR